MFTEEESLSNSNMDDIDIDQESMTNTSTIKSNSINPELVSCDDDSISSVVSNPYQDLTDTKNDISTSNDPAVGIFSNSTVAFTLSSNKNLLSHQKSAVSFSQNGKTHNAVASSSKTCYKVKQYRSISVSLAKHKTLCCKISTVIAICFTTGFSLIPIILYYANLTGNIVPTDLEYSQERNTSRAKIDLLKECNFSDSECADQILYTYEALRITNLPSSQKYCSDRVEKLFCDALMKCDNESYVKDIVCQQVRQEHCTSEWRMLELSNQTDGLIDCEEYEETAQLDCSDQFDLTNDGHACLPLCEEFSQFSETYTAFRNIFYVICLIIGIIGGIIVIAISYRKRKKMFKFPQLLVMINAGILIAVYAVILISTVCVDRWNILCSRKFLFDALNNPTSFCTVEGCLVTSGLIVYTYFWLLYISHLAIKIFYPLKSAKLFNSDYSTTIYIVEIIVIVVIGTTPAIVNAGLSNYEILVFPPSQCGNDDTIRFYVLILPIMTCNLIAGLLMLLAVYKIHVNYGILKTQHRDSVGKQICTCNFTVPEFKISFVLLYWVVHSILVWTGFSIRSGRADIFDYYLRSYTDCMAVGNRRDYDCQSLRTSLEAESNHAIEVIYFLSSAFLNFASVPFVIQFQTVKKSIRPSRKLTTTT